MRNTAVCRLASVALSSIQRRTDHQLLIAASKERPGRAFPDCLRVSILPGLTAEESCWDTNTQQALLCRTDGGVSVTYTPEYYAVFVFKQVRSRDETEKRKVEGCHVRQETKK